MKQTLSCTGCGKLMAELSKGAIVSHGFGIKVQKGAYKEDLAWAVCDVCTVATPFDASFLKAILNNKNNKE